MLNRTVSIAPMVDCTDRHFRYLMRLVSKHVLLYSEMITTNAILKGDRNFLLNFDPAEHPLALQLGGSNPQELAQCAVIGQDYGYDEINLNVGCPSDRVKAGQFGACLMLKPQLVAECINAMVSAVNIPVTVKTRIGVDNQDSYPELRDFIQTVAAGGCEIFIIHARKAWLSGLSPKQNREIPPIRYDVVLQLKHDFPSLKFVINGGFKDLSSYTQFGDKLDGVMIGREAYQNPYRFATVDKIIYKDNHAIPSREEIIREYCLYLNEHLRKGLTLSYVSRHLVGLYQGIPGARVWRRTLSENASRPGAGVNIIKQALASFLAHKNKEG